MLRHSDTLRESRPTDPEVLRWYEGGKSCKYAAMITVVDQDSNYTYPVYIKTRGRVKLSVYDYNHRDHHQTVLAGWYLDT